MTSRFTKVGPYVRIKPLVEDFSKRVFIPKETKDILVFLVSILLIKFFKSTRYRQI